MPELSKDPFLGDAMARAFFLRESPTLEHHQHHLIHHHVDHHLLNHPNHPNHPPQSLFYASASPPAHARYYSPRMDAKYSPMMDSKPSPMMDAKYSPMMVSKPVQQQQLQHYHHLQHQEQSRKLLLAAMSTTTTLCPPLLLPPDPDASFLRPSAFLPPPEIISSAQTSELSPQLQQSGVGVGVGVDCYPPLPLQLEVPEIEECSTWMSDVLSDFPAIIQTTQELSFPPLLSSSFDAIPPPPPDCSSSSIVVNAPPISLRAGLLLDPAATAAAADESAAVTTPPPCPTTPPTTSKVPEISSPSTAATPADSNVASSSKSPTPKPLKARGLSSSQSRRCHPKGVANNSEKVGTGAGTGTGKKVSNAEQLEHVRRERQRRDDMSFKIATLESLLPPAGPNIKRDRASIVHDSVHYLKSLQERVEELKKTFSELKLSKSSTRSSAPAPPAPRREHVNTTSPEMVASGSKSQVVEYHIQVEGEGDTAARLEKCRCRPDYMSGAMKVLERLNLDVRRCTVTKMFDYTICVIIVKPRLTSNQVASSSSVVNAFRSSLELT